MKKINPFAYAFFLLLVTGMIFNLSACQSGATTTTKNTDTQGSSTGTKASIEIKPNTDQPSAKKSAYKDGSFEGKGSYAIPKTPNEDGDNDNDKEDVTVRVVIKNGVVDSVDLQSAKANPISKKWQQTFLEGAQKQMVGKPLEQMGTFTKVNGSSLTGTGFQQALDQIKSEAQG